MAEDEPDGDSPSSPQTDPTNPHAQEQAGEWQRAEETAERRNAEPGLSDEGRSRRGTGS